MTITPEIINEAVIVTPSGKQLRIFDPKPEQIEIADIATALSKICRFSGMTERFYSVAEHSIYVSRLSGAWAMEGLLHDASEAYLGDIVRPLKRSGMYEAYIEAEHLVSLAIAEKFNLSYFIDGWPVEVERADKEIVKVESRHLRPWLPPKESAIPRPFSLVAGKTTMSPAEAERAFLDRFAELQTGLSLESTSKMGVLWK